MVDSKSLIPWMRICLSMGSVNQGFTNARDVMAASMPMRPREETPVDLSDACSNNVETDDLNSQINGDCHDLACVVRIVRCHGRSTRASSSLHLLCIRQVLDIWTYDSSDPTCPSVLGSICAPKVHAMEVNAVVRAVFIQLQWMFHRGDAWAKTPDWSWRYCAASAGRGSAQTFFQLS